MNTYCKKLIIIVNTILKKYFEPDAKKMEMLNNHIIDQFEDLEKEFGEDHFISTQAKKDVVFLLKNNTGKIILVKQL